MNDLQLKVLDIFVIFKEICKKLDLKYYMIAGSAIGAIREKGFIPWDDDLDVALPRKDYELFLQKASEFLPDGIFLQNYITDKNFPRSYSKLRNSNTTFLEIGVDKLKINHGIYIDIFPLDSFPGYNKIPNSFKLKDKFYNWIAFSALDDKTSFKVAFRNRIFRLFGFHKKTQKYLKKLELLYTSFGGSEEYLCDFNDRHGKNVMPADWFGDGVTATFEGLEVIVPMEYDKYLTNKYGNWRERPPLEQQKSHHLTTIIDLDKPYTEYIK